MSIYYGEHSIRFFPTEESSEEYSFAGFNASGEHCPDSCPDTWERWHLIPKDKPVFAPPGTEDSFITVPGRHGSVNLMRYTFDKPIYQQRSGSITFLIDPDYIKHRATIHSDMMAYFQGQERLAVLRDDRYYYYRGMFTVQKITPDKAWDEITLQYDLYPFKFERWSGGPWLWDDFDFETGVIRDYQKMTEVDADLMIELALAERDPTITVEAAPGDRIVSGSIVGIGKEPVYQDPDSIFPMIRSTFDKNIDAVMGLRPWPYTVEGQDDVFICKNGRVHLARLRIDELVFLSGNKIYSDSDLTTEMDTSTLRDGSILFNLADDDLYLYTAEGDKHYIQLSDLLNSSVLGRIKDGVFYTDYGCTLQAELEDRSICYDVFTDKLYRYVADGDSHFIKIAEDLIVAFWVDAAAVLEGDFCVATTMSEEDVVLVLQEIFSLAADLADIQSAIPTLISDGISKIYDLVGGEST